MYEKVLDETLRTAPERPELATLGQRIDAEQLRTMALNAAGLITAAAASEYYAYVRVREEHRDGGIRPESSGRPTYASPHAASVPTDRPGRRLARAVLGAGQSAAQRTVGAVAPQRWARMPYGRRLLAAVIGLRVRPEAPTVPEVRTHRTPTRPSAVRPPRRRREAASEESASGAGGLTVIAVLAPVLAGCAAVVCFLIGLLLTIVEPTPALAEYLVTAGWVFAALTGAGVLVVAAALVVMALRNGSTSLRVSTPGEDQEELDRAREAWETALREHGILPFLRDALADPSYDYDRSRPSSSEGAMGRMPRLGYSRPGLSPAGENTPTAPRPGLSSPDFSSPDFGGAEHRPD
nr:hypothetical protein [Streptomyces sp. SID14478]